MVEDSSGLGGLGAVDDNYEARVNELRPDYDPSYVPPPGESPDMQDPFSAWANFFQELTDRASENPRAKKVAKECLEGLSEVFDERQQ